MDKETFSRAIYDVVKLIPYGRATSYSLIAKAIGYPTMQRMVGRVLSQADSPVNVPAHRVVNSQGVLSGRAAFGENKEMQSLLEAEGIKIVNNKIKDWKNICWNPFVEINDL